MTRQEYIRQIMMEYVVAWGPILIIWAIIGLWQYNHLRREIPSLILMIASATAWIYFLAKFVW